MASKLCRLCTKSAQSVKALPNIFTRSNKELLVRVKELTGILLTNVRNVPQRICPQCVLDLEQAYSFRKRCIKAQSYYSSAAYRQLPGAESGKRMQLKVKRQTRADKQQAVDEVAAAPKAEPTQQAEEEEQERCISGPEMELDTEIVLLKCEPELSDLSNSQEALAIALDDEQYLPLLECPLKDEQQSSSVKLPTHKTTALASATMRTLSVKRHKKRRADERQTEFICDQCGNHFKVYSHFQMHLKRHTGEKTHQCEVCPDKFFTHSELTRHMRRHTGERPFACRHCQRRFTDYSTRVKHERTHTNERPFLCTHCGKAFTTSYILKNHMLVHTGERSFKCHSCNKSFQRQTHLIVHYRSIMHKQNEEKQQHLPDSLAETVTNHWQPKS